LAVSLALLIALASLVHAAEPVEIRIGYLRAPAPKSAISLIDLPAENDGNRVSTSHGSTAQGVIAVPPESVECSGTRLDNPLAVWHFDFRQEFRHAALGTINGFESYCAVKRTQLRQS